VRRLAGVTLMETESMVSVTYIEHNGTPHTVDVSDGLSVMKGAVDHVIPGIDGDCGGACACATCHVYVAEPWQHLTGEASQDEKDMLECAIDPTEASRLGCQITLTAALNGLVVHMPRAQR
jgi:2Fe-2S ferredoxin